MKLTLPCIYVGSLQVVFSINDNNKNQLQRVVTFAVQNTQAEIAAKSIHIADLWILPIFVQTLGLSHALTSFMWLCGPIAGLVVSTILFFAQMLFFFLTAVIIHWSFFYCLSGSTARRSVQWQVHHEMGTTEAIYSDWMSAHLSCRKNLTRTLSNPFRCFLRTELIKTYSLLLLSWGSLLIFFKLMMCRLWSLDSHQTLELLWETQRKSAG